MENDDLRAEAANAILEAIRKRANATTAADQLEILARAYAQVTAGSTGH